MNLPQILRACAEADAALRRLETEILIDQDGVWVGERMMIVRRAREQVASLENGTAMALVKLKEPQ